MKVIVCFANTKPESPIYDKIVVPCDEGAITVRELASRASLRYKRIFIKNETNCDILFLKILTSNALLDFEDHVKDVIDNNELLVACFNEQQIYDESNLNHADEVFAELTGDDENIQKSNEDSNDAQQENDDPSAEQNYEPTYSSSESVEFNSLLEVKEPGNGRLNGYKCGVCYEAFPDHDTFIKHQKRHNQQNLLKCPNCPRFFAEQQFLDQHVRAHSRAERRNKPRYVTCEICGKILKNPDNLKRHMLVHSDERPFHCSQCGKNFRAKADLKVHQRIHTGERPYWCPVSDCGKAFNDRSSFRRHKMVHSRGRVSSKSLPGPTVPVYTALEINEKKDKDEKDKSDTTTFLNSGLTPTSPTDIDLNTETLLPSTGTTTAQLLKNDIIEVEIGSMEEGRRDDVNYVVIKSNGVGVTSDEHPILYAINNILQCKYCGDVEPNGEAMKEHLLLNHSEQIVSSAEETALSATIAVLPNLN